MRTILVAFNGAKASINALRHAAQIARHSNGYVTALLAHAPPAGISALGDLLSSRAQDEIATAMSAHHENIEACFEELRDDLDLKSRLRLRRATGDVDEILTEYVRCFDILLTGQYRPDDVEEDVIVTPDIIALNGGRPVLAVPPDSRPDSRYGNVVLAWDGRRAAARAISDACMLIPPDGLVNIITVGDGVSQRQVEDLQDYLKCHGLRFSYRNLPKTAEPTGRTLLNYCQNINPDLLVLGAYEHSRFRETLVGGVTKTVLHECAFPVLMSH